MKVNRKKQKKAIFGQINKRNIIWLFVAAFVSIQVLFTIQTASSGAKLAELEREEQSLIKSNQELSRYLVELSSLSEMEKTADELGFNKPVSTFYISMDEIVAKLP